MGDHLGYIHCLFSVAKILGKSFTNRLELRTTQLTVMLIGLSKERPILGDHPKAHIHEIRRISCGFHEIWQISGEIHWISCGFHLKSGGFRKTNCQGW